MIDLIEQQIRDKKLEAPRVRPEDLEAEIASEHYFTAADGVAYNIDRPGGPYNINLSLAAVTTLELLTICVLVLKNGIKVTGESACVSAANFNAETGRKIARANAVEKIWPLLGFRLADRLAFEKRLAAVQENAHLAHESQG